MAAAVCRFVLLDGDADEHYPEICGGDDCDDTDATSYPGALDVCDGADNDCNGSVDPQSAALLCGAGRVCSGGSCACAANTMACRGRCLTAELFQSDVNNCGSCGNQCGAGRSCSEGVCEDVDECAEDADRCGAHASCMNTVGSFGCECDDGWGTAVGGGCADVNECYAATDNCDSYPEACINTEGSFSCECPDGYSGDGVGVDGCADVDECAGNDDDCTASEVCINRLGSFACSQTARQVEAFGSSTCALLADFSLKCWGENGYGQLGIGDPYVRGTSANDFGANLLAVSLGTGLTARSVTGGIVHACALLQDFSIKCWGSDYPPVLGLESQVAIGDNSFEMGNALPAVALGTGLTAKAVVAGANHTCAILEDDSVKCWGANDAGQLGLGNTDARSDGFGEMGDALPAVALGTGRTAKAIALGDAHTCALLNDDSVKCWGFNGSGQLGQGDVQDRGGAAAQMGDALQPVALGMDRTAKAITANGAHTCALLDNDNVKCWGYNGLGQLGLGDGNTRGDQAGEMGDALLAVQLGSGRTAKAIAAGTNHTCALLDNNTVKCWGYGAQGQLGQGNTLARGDNAAEMGEALPPIALGDGRTAQAITAGESHSCALLDDGSIKCWGWNGSGQLGVGDTAARGDNSGEMGNALPVVDVGR
jgi:alpha-tubulin suppressor-like RCC1 family protein